MGGFLGGSKPQPADTSAIDEQRKQNEEDKAKVERENKAKIRNRRGANAKPLTMFDTAKGVTGSSKQKTLG